MDYTTTIGSPFAVRKARPLSAGLAAVAEEGKKFQAEQDAKRPGPRKPDPALDAVPTYDIVQDRVDRVLSAGTVEQQHLLGLTYSEAARLISELERHGVKDIPEYDKWVAWSEGKPYPPPPTAAPPPAIAAPPPAPAPVANTQNRTQAFTDELEIWWPLALDAGELSDSLKRLAVFAFGVWGFEASKACQHAVRAIGLANRLGVDGTSLEATAMSIYDETVRTSKLKKEQRPYLPIFLLVGQIHTRLGADHFGDNYQQIRGVELAVVLKVIVVNLIANARRGRTTALAHKYFLTSFGKTFKRKTGRSLNANKLRIIINKLQELGFISRENHKTRAPGTRNRYRRTTYTYGCRPPLLPAVFTFNPDDRDQLPQPKSQRS